MQNLLHLFDLPVAHFNCTCSYYVVDRVKHEVLTGGFDPASGAVGGSITFFDINTVTDVWTFVNGAQSPLK